MGRQSLFTESPLGIPWPNVGWGHPEDTALTACGEDVTILWLGMPKGLPLL